MKKLLRNKSGFTLVELITSIAILLIAIGGSLVSVEGYTSQSNIMKAQSDVNALSIAVTQYKYDLGSYPASLSALDTKTSGKGPWISNRAAKDPWKTDYQYDQATGKVWSMGPDKTSGNSDDINPQ